MEYSLIIQEIRLKARKAFDEEEQLPDLYDDIEWSLVEIRRDLAKGKICLNSNDDVNQILSELEELRRLVFARIKELWP